ncbi:MAG: serine/threonine protein kinase [Candidatus Schekmanbacteria bacterium]|nr:serine/threonine protein kinase [Candidatus Schekmanbacteria bacterium]
MKAGRLARRLGLRIVRQMGEALAYAHARNVIHRDVKSSNVLLTPESWALLADFGIAKVLEGSAVLSRTGTIAGTPEYMAPEQGHGKADHRSDIYALGVILYEVLTGRVPYEAETPLAVLIKHMQDPPPLPLSRVVAPEVSERLEKVILKAMAKDPGERFQSCAEFLGALEGSPLSLARDEAEARRRRLGELVRKAEAALEMDPLHAGARACLS